jgi:hypothetical protein
MSESPKDPGSNPTASLPFVMRTQFDQPELLGASWWQERLRAAPGRAGSGVEPNRRQALQTLLALGGFAVLGVGFGAARCSSSRSSGIQTALELQQTHGMTIDANGVPFVFSDLVFSVCDGTQFDNAVLQNLATLLRPARQDLQPFYVPTLFQSLAAPSAGPLRDAIRPMHNAALERAEARGAAIRELLAVLEQPQTLAMVVDLPGPEAVAFAAGLAGAVDVVCAFDNWPHPRGVVPSHQTLAAALYYAPRLAQPLGQAPRPLCLVLDRNRILPYHNEPDRFDNRYLARLPDTKALRALGITRLLYVAAEGVKAEEADDLNDEFVAYREGGLSVQLLGTGDLRLADPAPTAGNNSGNTASGTSGSAARGGHYLWLGSPMHHWWFWSHYGFPHRQGPLAGVQPNGPVFGAGYRPTPRPSAFTGRPAGGLGLLPSRGGSNSSSSRGGSWGRSSGFTGS